MKTDREKERKLMGSDSLLKQQEQQHIIIHYELVN